MQAPNGPHWGATPPMFPMQPHLQDEQQFEETQAERAQRHQALCLSVLWIAVFDQLRRSETPEEAALFSIETGG